MSSEAYRNVAKALLEAQRELDAALIALQELEASAKRAGWIRTKPTWQPASELTIHDLERFCAQRKGTQS